MLRKITTPRTPAPEITNMAFRPMEYQSNPARLLDKRVKMLAKLL